MPRTPRIAPKENIYHVLTRGNNRQNIFKENRDYEKYEINTTVSFEHIELFL